MGPKRSEDDINWDTFLRAQQINSAHSQPQRKTTCLRPLSSLGEMRLYGLVFMLISGKTEALQIAATLWQVFRAQKSRRLISVIALAGQRAPQWSAHIAGETFAPSEESRPGHIIIIYKNKQAIRVSVCARTPCVSIGKIATYFYIFTCDLVPAAETSHNTHQHHTCIGGYRFP